MTKDNVSRRAFLKTGVAGAAVATSVLSVPSPVKALNANERLKVAFLGTGGRCQAHIGAVMKLQKAGKPIEAAAVCDVFNHNRERSAERIKKTVGGEPIVTGDYRELIDNKAIDAVCIAAPDHWHAKMTIDALDGGKHVYCEKPMTHTIQESQDVVAAWEKSGTIMQVGTQNTADGRWKAANKFIRGGGIGKVVQAQTHYYRNSGMGQWRYYKLSREMTPKNIDWKMFLGTDFGLSPYLPFDRAVFGQWRCYWPFGSGLFTDLFVHRLTDMLITLGLRYPRRVVGGGGIFLEYDGRDVPDTATITVDYDAGLQVLVTASMVSSSSPIDVCVRGHHGSIVLSTPTGFEFKPERPQVTRKSDLKPQEFKADKPKDLTLAQWENFLEAIGKNDQQACNCPPDLGAAAISTITMGAESYRFGKVYEWDAEAKKKVESSDAYAKQWEDMSKNRSAPRHVPGWKPIDKDSMFSRQIPRDYQKLEGPWKDEQTDPVPE